MLISVSGLPAVRSVGGGYLCIIFHMFEEIISTENLFESWKEFLRGKRGKTDVQEFSLHLADNIFELHRELLNHTYRHGQYQSFRISDPKPRDISKASVRDRLLHHAIYRILYPYFDCRFVADSFSCRRGRGTHKALDRFRAFAYRVGKNQTRTAWILKCDIRKFFANIDHEVLKEILGGHVRNSEVLRLLHWIISSFSTPGNPGKGLPLGNLTSQLLVNAYMHEFDWFVKHKLKARHYIRYADDFLVMSDNKEKLEEYLSEMRVFLRNQLKLSLHPDKVSITTLASGIDFLGWVHFPDHRVLRTSTKRRMLKRIQEHPGNETIQSYLGLLSHGNSRKLEARVRLR